MVHVSLPPPVTVHVPSCRDCAPTWALVPMSTQLQPVIPGQAKGGAAVLLGVAVGSGVAVGVVGATVGDGVTRSVDASASPVVLVDVAGGAAVFVGAAVTVARGLRDPASLSGLLVCVRVGWAVVGAVMAVGGGTTVWRAGASGWVSGGAAIAVAVGVAWSMTG